MINKEYSDALIQMAYARAEGKILQAVIDVAEERNRGFVVFKNFDLRSFIEECHEEVLQEYLGD